MRGCRFVLLLAILPLTLSAQIKDSIGDEGVNSRRLRAVMIGGGAAYSLTLVGLSQLWYKETAGQSFHFFDDAAQWKQVDKVGHFYSAFYLSYGTSRLLRWCNVPEEKTILPAALTGFLLLLPVEILDGYSSEYGASVGDLAANAAGAAFFMGQNLAWGDIRIIPKFSYHATEFAAKRPEVLGDNFAGKLLKDYNAQTCWLSFDVDKFFRFPKWLNIAFGYGATNMVYAHDGVNALHGFDAYRQYYFSLDWDLTAIPTRSKAVKTILTVLSVIKIPSPTVEFSKEGTRFHVLY